MRRRRSRLERAVPAALLPLLALGLACSRLDLELEVGEPDFAGGVARVEIAVGADLQPGSLRVWLDGRPVTSAFSPTDGGVVASLALEPGRHRLAARARTRPGPTPRGVPVLDFLRFEAPPATPALLEAHPGGGATAVPRSEWLRLRFARAPDPRSLETLGLVCDGEPVSLDSEHLGEGWVVANPAPEMPAGAACALAWRGPEGVEQRAFLTAAAGPPAHVRYDRTGDAALDPLPDDFFLVEDASTPTGRRAAVPVPDRTVQIEGLFRALLHDVNALDGWSPIAHWVVAVSDPVDPDSVPTTPARSLDPLAPVALLDVTPGAESFGERVPFRLDVRDDSAAGVRGQTLLLFPSRPLRPRGQYALVVTRRALVDPGRPLEPSPFLGRALAPPEGGEPAAVARVRELVAPVVEHLEQVARPRVPREDLALVLRVSVRSTDSIPDDLLAMKQQILDAPPPALLDYTVEPGPGDVAAVVRGHWDAPDWRAPGPAPNVSRGPDGRPRVQGSRPVEFVLALPEAASDAPAPLVFHQHGNPGSQEEVVTNARRFLAEAGFAAVGFTDILNREVAPPGPSDQQRIEAQVFAIFFALLSNRTLPDHWLETTAEQLAFLRFLPELSDLDVLPLDAPDGVPDLDLAAPLSYHGISEGGNNGQALLPYAPELAAAALVVGGARLAEVLIHQQPEVFLETVPFLFPGLAPVDIWTGLSLFQAGFDRQDRHNHLEFAFRNPVVVAGTDRKPGVLVIEGLDDSLVPNHATDSTAAALGLPHLAPVQRPVPFLEVVEGPVQGNLPDGGTGAYFQYVPVGVPGIPPTPGCAETLEMEGHYCAQSARESRLQRVLFFRSALEGGPPEIVNPFPLFED